MHSHSLPTNVDNVGSEVGIPSQPQLGSKFKVQGAEWKVYACATSHFARSKLQVQRKTLYPIALVFQGDYTHAHPVCNRPSRVQGPG